MNQRTDFIPERIVFPGAFGRCLPEPLRGNGRLASPPRWGHAALVIHHRPLGGRFLTFALRGRARISVPDRLTSTS